MDMQQKIDKTIKEYNLTKDEFINVLHTCVDEYFDKLKQHEFRDNNNQVIIPHLYLALNRNRCQFGLAVPTLKGSTTLTDNGSIPLDVFDVIRCLAH